MIQPFQYLSLNTSHYVRFFIQFFQFLVSDSPIYYLLFFPSRNTYLCFCHTVDKFNSDTPRAHTLLANVTIRRIINFQALKFKPLEIILLPKNLLKECRQPTFFLTYLSMSGFLSKSVPRYVRNSTSLKLYVFL